MKRAITLVGILSMTVLAACHDSTSVERTSNNGGGQTSQATQNADFYVTYKGEEPEANSTIKADVGDKTAIIVCHMNDDSTPEFTFASSDDTVASIGEHSGLINAKKAGTAVITVYPSEDKEQKIELNLTVEDSTVASGAHTYAAASYDEKSRILGALEKYAVDNYLTGITMFSNGSNVCYNTRYVPTPKSYVTGYGWGTYREGNLTSNISKPLAGRNPAFYQVATTQLPSHANAMNASGSDISTIYGYIANQYYSTRLNQTADGYEYYPSLATDAKPLPIDENGNVITENQTGITNTRWRIHVKTGDDFVYRTASTRADVKKFDGRKVALEDYLTPLKLMLTCYNGQYRGAELTKGVSGFAKAAAKYYAHTTKNSGNQSDIYNAAEWQACGMDDVIKTGHDASGDYIEFELLQPCTQFYAMYYLSSTLYSPLPEDFIKIWGAKNLGKLPDGYSPVDTMLSTGPYYITEWTTKNITFTKNDRYFYKQDVFRDGNKRDVYNLPGFQYNEVEDSSMTKNYFLDGSIDAYAPNKDDLQAEFKGTEGEGKNMSWRKYETKGDANFKLNVNAATEQQWNERFGTAGTVFQHDSAYIADKSSHPFLKSRPYMSNIHFLNFLSFGLNRGAICEARGMKATQEYFSDNYLIDPESGISYNSTDAHKAVLADRYNDTYGYNHDVAKNELRIVMDTTIADMVEKRQLKSDSSTGAAGTEENPWIIPINMEWMNVSDTKDYSDVFDSIKDIFNELISEEYYNGYKLKISEPTPSSDYQAVYNKMKQGEFDLGFGAISGGDLDPINFMEVLKSDNSSTFTLNWGPDTDKISESDQSPIVYDGKKWSYDALWNAANTGVLLTESGNIANAENVSPNHSGIRYDGIDKQKESVTYKLSFEMLVQAGARNITFEITNSEYTEMFDLTQLGGNEANKYVVSVTLGKDFNHYEEYDEFNKTNVTVTATIATVTINYQVEINGVTKNFSSLLKLRTYRGIVPEEE